MGNCLPTGEETSEPAAADQQLPKYLHLQGSTNFRDLGGYTTADGRTVASGRIFRSASLRQLTEADIKLMSDTGIKTQMCMEGRGPAGTAVGTSHESLRTWDIEEVDMFASEPQTDEKSAKVELMDFHKIFGGAMKKAMEAGSIQVMIDSMPDGDLLPRMYLSLLYHSGDRIATVLRRLMAPENHPAVFNCMMGQDRTGVVAFLLLALLDVPAKTRVEDYVKSATPEVLSKMREHMENPQMMPPGLSPTPEDMEQMRQRMEKNFIPRAEFIEGVERAIVQDWGTAREYVKWIGIDDEAIDAYRDAMLEK